MTAFALWAATTFVLFGTLGLPVLFAIDRAR